MWSAAAYLFSRSQHCSGPPSGGPAGGRTTGSPGLSPSSSAVSSRLPGSRWESLPKWGRHSLASWGTAGDWPASVHKSDEMEGEGGTKLSRLTSSATSSSLAKMHRVCKRKQPHQQGYQYWVSAPIPRLSTPVVIVDQSSPTSTPALCNRTDVLLHKLL